MKDLITDILKSFVPGIGKWAIKAVFLLLAGIFLAVIGAISLFVLIWNLATKPAVPPEYADLNQRLDRLEQRLPATTP